MIRSEKIRGVAGPPAAAEALGPPPPATSAGAAAAGLAAGRGAPPAALVLAAFAAIYLIWGSTYLAIRVVVQTMPPLLSAGARFLAAGAILYAFMRLRGVGRPKPAEWIGASICGTLMLLGGNGGVVLAETLIDSGAAALLVATMPMLMVAVNALRPGGVCPSLAELAGLLVGFAGVWVLVRPDTGGGVHPIGAGLVVCGSLSWAIGSIYSRHAKLPKSPLLSTAMQMLAGGAALTLAAGLRGEWARVDPAVWSPASLAALLYLVAFGSIIAFSAYIWLLQVSTPARVATYAYVNPPVAVFLGWLILGEPLGPSLLAAMALIVVAVVVITRFGRRART
jgi:drug/metabolite transporter (DMT)-like permease